MCTQVRRAQALDTGTSGKRPDYGTQRVKLRLEFVSEEVQKLWNERESHRGKSTFDQSGDEDPLEISRDSFASLHGGH
jgi:hypothetical protein